MQKLHNHLDIKGNALKKLSSRVQIFPFDIFRDHTFSFALITVSDWGAGHLISPTKVKALCCFDYEKKPGLSSSWRFWQVCCAFSLLDFDRICRSQSKFLRSTNHGILPPKSESSQMQIAPLHQSCLIALWKIWHIDTVVIKFSRTTLTKKL